MAVHAHTAPSLGASRRSIITPARSDQATAASRYVHDLASDNHSPTRGVLYRPGFLRRALAYLANGDLPPVLAFVIPPPLNGEGYPPPKLPPLPGGFPKPDAAPCLAHFVECALLAGMGCLGIGMILVGATL